MVRLTGGEGCPQGMAVTLPERDTMPSSLATVTRTVTFSPLLRLPMNNDCAIVPSSIGSTNDEPGHLTAR